MFKNYFITAWRNLKKNSLISTINIIGLSISVTLCLLLFFYIKFERSYDTFHKDGDRLFRLESTNLFNFDEDSKAPKTLLQKISADDKAVNSVVFPVVAAQDLQSTFPEIESITRMQGGLSEKRGWDRLVKVGDKVFKDDGRIEADDNFFQNLNFRLIRGNPVTVLKGPHSVVLSQSAATRYFGNRDPVGQTIVLDNDSTLLYTVTGVSADTPANSGIRFSMVVNMTSLPDYAGRIAMGFGTWSHQYIIRLGKSVDKEAFQRKLNKWVCTYYKDAITSTDPEKVKNYQWSLRPLDQCHYSAAYWGHYTNPQALYLLTCLFLLILLLAAVNYVLLAVSGAMARIKEVGIRKIMGAGRAGLILQLWLETLLIVSVCIVIGLGLSYLLLPVFNGLLNTRITFSVITVTNVLGAGFVLALVLSILAGLYPALAISSSKPTAVIKSGTTFRINPRFSNPLIVFQFTICIILLISIMVISAQMRYISRRDLGYNKDHVLLIKNDVLGDQMKDIRSRLFNYARSQPAVLAISGMGGDLKGAGNHNGFKLNGEQKWYNQISVDYDYFKLLKIPLIAGRVFSPESTTDTVRKARTCVINETFLKLLGPGVKLGEYNETIRSTIIGVVRDYNFESLTKQIEPQQHVLTGFYENYFMFRVQGDKMQETIAGFGNEWKRITNYPFEYDFLDDSVAEMYAAELRWQRIINMAGLFAVFIACLGLFGFSLLSAINRMKEVSIRKVLGATIMDISMLLSGKMVRLIMIALVIATPVAWIIMNGWLQEYAYRVTLSWWIFVLAGLLVVVIALLTIGFQTIRTAVANPVKALRSE